MSLFYALHQDQSTGTKRSGKWYARAKYVTTLNTRDIARIVERNATAKDEGCTHREEVQLQGAHQGCAHHLPARDQG